MNSIIKKLQKNPELAKYLELGTLRDILIKANQIYYLSDNPQPLFDDETYDIIRDIYEQRLGGKVDLEVELPQAPEDDTDRIKVPLPVHMGSMTKIKETQKSTKSISEMINDWKARFKQAKEVVLTHKLDGASGLYFHLEDGYHLYTREGWDISYLIPYLKLPKTLPLNTGARGEFIMSKKAFQRYFAKDYANARNLVSGQINSKPSSINKEIIKHIDFVVYEFISKNQETQPKPSDQLKLLKSMGFKVVHWMKLPIELLTEEFLEQYLMTERERSEYEIDGIVVMADLPIDRTMIDPRGNPKYAFAYKKDLSGVPTVIEKIEWNVDKTGRLTPVAVFKPVNIQGSTVGRATALHAQYVTEHNLGRGSKILVTKGGDVIPKISRVLTPSTTGEPEMPTVPYRWGDRDSPYIYSISSTPEQSIKQLEYLFKLIGVKHLGPELIKKIYQAGYTSIIDWINLSLSDLLEVSGLGEKTARKIYQQLTQALSQADLIEILAGSGIFGEGIGTKRLYLIFKENPAWIKNFPPTVSLDQLTSISGIGPKLAKQLHDLWIIAYNFVMHVLPEKWRKVFIKNTLEKLGLYRPLKLKKIKKISASGKSPIKQRKKIKLSARLPSLPKELKKVLLTGFRDKQLTRELERRGATIASSYSKSLTALIIKDEKTFNKKVAQAKDDGIPIYTRQQVMKILGLSDQSKN